MVATMTWFKIYKQLCKELDIMFPLQQKELSVPINPIPNSLEFQKRNATKLVSYEEYQASLYERAAIYYKICKMLGFDVVEDLSGKNETFKLRSSEHPDRYVNLHTVISVLYLSGFKGSDLIQRSIDYLQN